MTPFRRLMSSVVLRPLLFGFLASLASSSGAIAGSVTQPRLALHLQAATSKNACGRTGATPACHAIVTRGDLYPTTYFAYLLITNGDRASGLAGLSCGLRYNGAPHQGVDIYSWVSCAGLNFPMNGWPASGTGNLLVWDNQNQCQRQEPGGPGTGVVATAGYFYLTAYSPDVLELTKRPVDDLAVVGDCNSMEYPLEGHGVHHDPSLLGTASFSTGGVSAGYNPCADSPEPIPCLISGPVEMEVASTSTFFADEAPPGAYFAWSVAGQGTIVGPTTSPSVSVLAVSPGSVQLSVVINEAGVLSSCSSSIPVQAPAATCVVDGLAELTEGQIGEFYHLDFQGPFDSVLWQITGDGTMTSDPTRNFVEVTAGNVGAFELSARVSRAGQPVEVCSKVVNVNPFVCDIRGMSPAYTHGVDLVYGAGPELEGASYDWQITGDAAIHGSTHSHEVLITTNEPGAFTLALMMSRSGRTLNCSRTFSVAEFGNTTGPDANAKLLIHLTPVAAREACGSSATPRCTAAITAGGLFPSLYYAHLIVGDVDATAGLASLQFGIDYDPAPHSGVDVFSWTLCAMTEIPREGPHGPWPAPGSGNAILWDQVDNCQRNEPGGAGTGVVATAGYFYMAAYSSGQLEVKPFPGDGRAIVYDCRVIPYLIGGIGFPPKAPSQLGFANFTEGGHTPGFNPCGGNVTVRVTTWSSIKALYGTPAATAKP